MHFISQSITFSDNENHIHSAVVSKLKRKDKSL